jgi:large subunit ribosomal protein L3
MWKLSRKLETAKGIFMSENTANTESAKTASLSCVYGVKTGMTRVFDAEGKQTSVTVVSLQSPTLITQVKTKEKEGYDAIQIAMLPKKAQRTNKASNGHFKKVGQAGFYFVEEIRLPKADATLGVGAVIDPAAFLVENTFIDARGLTKGKGFQGVMKVWNFGGMPATHGHSVSHRSGGSIGNRADPGRVMRGKKMATRLGGEMQTTQNLRVVGYDPEAKVVLIEGAVPGARNGVVRLTRAVKKPNPKKKA